MIQYSLKAIAQSTPGKNGYLSLCKTLLSSIQPLLVSAWNLINLQGRSPTLVVLHHKVESIRLLNKRLLNSNHVAIDSTIAAVACLTAIEVFTQRNLPFIYTTNFWSEPNGKCTWRENTHGWFGGPGKKQRWHTRLCRYMVTRGK